MRRLFCAFLTLVLLCGVFPLTSYAAKPVELSSNYGYGYSFLTQAEKSVYEDISKCIENMDSEVGVDYALGVNVERFSLIVEMVLADNPQYFWFLGSYSYSYAGGFVVGFYPTYSLDGSTVSKTEIVAANAVFEQKLQAILDELSLRGLKDDYDKAVWLHDKVAHIVTYAFGANNQSAYGALVDGYAVCAGYTRLYQTLLLRAGIPAWTVKGTSIDPVSNTPTNHAWTLLWINGNCVYTDLTWNDQGTELYHLYFANGLSEFAETHIPRAPYDELLPECQCVDLGYFDVYAPQYAADSSIDSGKVKELLVANDDGRSWDVILFDPTGNYVLSWLMNSGAIWDVVADLGAGSFSISSTYMMGNGVGMEIHLTITNKSAPVTTSVGGLVTSYLDNGQVTVQLINKQSQKIEHQTSFSGNSNTFSFKGVSAGNYTLRVMKANHVTQDFDISVAGKPVSQNVKICPIGDVTGDGKVNMKDWSALYAHINEISKLSGYSFSCADVTKDGKLNMKDWNRLYGHISETNPLW